MHWVLLALAAVSGGGVLVRRLRADAARRDDDQAELDGVRRLADEDVTVLGEQLARLDAAVGDRALDDDARADYQVALDAYESAGRAVQRLRRADDVSAVTDTLTTGRFALACVLARVEGRPLPERRVPCFFNPQHGPSVADVLWTRPGRGTRTVPACAQDVARIRNDEVPVVRQVRIGSRTVPYWEAGTAYLPYGEGYFAAATAMSWMWQPPMEVGGGWSGDGGAGGFGGGFGGGFDGGGFDGGGFDGGGGGDGGGGP